MLSCPLKSVLSKGSDRLQIARRRRWRLGQQGWPTTNVTDWKQEQKEDPVLYQVAKHLRVPRETFKAALHKVLNKKATATYIKVKEQLLIKNGLLYRKTWQGQADEIVFQFVVSQRHRGAAPDGCH